MTNAQNWAKQRNFAKFRLEGVKKTLHNLSTSNYLLTTERNELKSIILSLNNTIDSWKIRTPLSKKKFMEGGK